MAEYIERSVVVRRVMETKWERGSDGAAAMEIVASAPAADVVPVVHGRWIPQSNNAGGEYTICSACRCNLQVAADGEIGLMDMRGASYCPNCGAKMDGGDDDAAD